MILLLIEKNDQVVESSTPEFGQGNGRIVLNNILLLPAQGFQLEGSFYRQHFLSRKGRQCEASR